MALPAARIRGLFVPVGSLALLAATLGLVLASAGSTLGYDYTCYEAAARRIADGKTVYDPAFSTLVSSPLWSANPCPVGYTYPPPFAVALVPWLALGGAAATAWCLAMAACFLGAVAIMPVRRDVRWLVVVLGALDWPLLYSVKIGQVGPLLLLACAVVWRWMDRAGPAGAAIAVGALVKVQPALLVAWAAVTGRIRAAAGAVAVGLGLVLATTLVTGAGAWSAYADLLARVNGSLGSAHNVAPGAVAHFAGASDAVASAVQLGSIALAVAALLVAWRFADEEASLLATIVASQLLASPLRDHYALILLLPTAWLVERGRTWAVVFPLAGWISLFAQHDEALPAASVPLAFFLCLAAIVAEGLRERRARSTEPAGRVATAAGSAA